MLILVDSPLSFYASNELPGFIETSKDKNSVKLYLAISTS